MRIQLKLLPSFCIGALLLLSGPFVHTAISQGGPNTLDSFVAMVNGKIITRGDVAASVREQAQAVSLRFQGKEASQKIQELFSIGLERLINRNLVIADLLADGLEIPDRAIDSQIKQDISERFEGDDSAFRRMLKQNQRSFQEYRIQVRDDMIFDYARAKRIRALINISPTDVRKAYEENLSDFSMPAHLQFRLISLKFTDDAERATAVATFDEIRNNANTDEAFGEAAKTLTQGPYKDRGGDSGPIPFDKLSPVLQKQLQPLSAGDIGQPFEMAGALNIIRLTKRQEAEAVDFERVQPRIDKFLRDKEEARLFKDYVEPLRKKYPVTLFTDD